MLVGKSVIYTPKRDDEHSHHFNMADAPSRTLLFVKRVFLVIHLREKDARGKETFNKRAGCTPHWKKAAITARQKNASEVQK